MCLAVTYIGSSRDVNAFPVVMLMVTAHAQKVPKKYTRTAEHYIQRVLTKSPTKRKTRNAVTFTDTSFHPPTFYDCRPFIIYNYFITLR